jgi:hypothetical protein
MHHSYPTSALNRMPKVAARDAPPIAAETPQLQPQSQSADGFARGAFGP